MRLNDIELNQFAKVISIEHNASMKRRLMDLGIVKDCLIYPILQSPSRGMRAYMIKGCKIGLRMEESSSIIVEEVKEDTSAIFKNIAS